MCHVITKLHVSTEIKAARRVIIKASPSRKVEVTARFSPRDGSLVVCEDPDPERIERKAAVTNMMKKKHNILQIL